MARTIDRIKALEAALLAPQVQMMARTFMLPMTLAYLDDPEGETAKARAIAVGSGIILHPDAYPTPIFEDEATSEAVCMAQQARLIADGQADIARAAARDAERTPAATVGKQPPTPQRKHKPPPTFTPSIFARH